MTPSREIQFETWMRQDGARHVVADLFRAAAPYAKRYQRTGQRVSMRLLWEGERDRIGAVRLRLQRRGMDLAKWGGYRMNDHLAPCVARHIIARRPDWDGMFELRDAHEMKPIEFIAQELVLA